MANLNPDHEVDVHVGDAQRRVSYIWKTSTQASARVLTGYAAWIEFWYLDSDPHIVRAAKVDGANGLTIDVLQGDEFTMPGEVNAQFGIMLPDWYVAGQAGISYITTPSKIMKFRVHARPT